MAGIITGFTNWLWSVIQYCLVVLVNNFVKMFNYLIESIAALGYAASSLLPTYTPPSPGQFIEQSGFLNALNWVLPISFFIDCLAMLVFAYAAYYLVAPALRWVKLLR